MPTIDRFDCSTTDQENSFNSCNFKALLKLRAALGDVALRHHLTSEKESAMYTSKSIQNELLQCIKGFILTTAWNSN